MKIYQKELQTNASNTVKELLNGNQSLDDLGPLVAIICPEAMSGMKYLSPLGVEHYRIYQGS